VLYSADAEERQAFSAYYFLTVFYADGALMEVQ